MPLSYPFFTKKKNNPDFPSLWHGEEQASRSLLLSHSRQQLPQARDCTSESWTGDLPLSISERGVLNFKYSTSWLFFPIKLPFYRIVSSLNTMNFIANLTFICNVYLLLGERGRAVCFLLCQTVERYSRPLPITSSKNQIYFPQLQRAIFTGYLCTFTNWVRSTWILIRYKCIFPLSLWHPDMEESADSRGCLLFYKLFTISA